MKRTGLLGLVLMSLGFALVVGLSAQNTNAQTQADSAGTVQNDIDPGGAYGELVRMVQAGVEQGVVLVYINNSLRLFNLDADRIIYLTDIGAPPEIIEAAMERDRQLIEEGISPGASQPVEDKEPVEEQPVEVTEDDFNDTLAPYGVWVEVDGYGRCWRPTVLIYNSSWQPYCDNGRWVYTDHGWYWRSNYSWGWATFHYGRWFNHSRYGWCWWPDTIWAPSWVCWRYERSYCGWAPLPPYTAYRSGVGFVYRGSRVAVGFDFGLNAGSFTFVSIQNFSAPKPWRHRIKGREAAQIYGRTSVSHGIGYDKKHRRVVNSGIPPQDITAVTRKEIKPVSIRQRKGTLFIDRPKSAKPRTSDRGAVSSQPRKTKRSADRNGFSKKTDRRKPDVTKAPEQKVNRPIPQPSPDRKMKSPPRVAPKKTQERSKGTAPQVKRKSNPSPKQVHKNNKRSSPPPKKVAPPRKQGKPSPASSPKSNGKAKGKQSGG